MLKRGTLLELVERATASALASGELRPILTRSEFIEDSVVQFLVRVITDPHGKGAPQGKAGMGASPFLAHDDALFVAVASPTHLCRLNRYPVVDRHLLIVTREYEEQDALLNERDFQALAVALREYDSLGFYNGGKPAGASQTHKHLQLVPLPISSPGPGIPIEPLLRPAAARAGVTQSARLPFRHALARLDEALVDDPPGFAAKSLDLFQEMLHYAGLDAFASQPPAYNLVLTREWMLLIPRSRDKFHSISLNSLAFAGALLVKNEEQLALLKQHGPMAALRAVTLDAPCEQ